MKAGDLDQQITIQVAALSRGATGEQIVTWATYKTVWAQVLTSGGFEKFYNPQLVAESTHKILIRYLANVTADMRITWGSKSLDIIHVDESRRREGELYLLCKEVV
jgi:SPP1 family predicted phage head-tail adaptor